MHIAEGLERLMTKYIFLLTFALGQCVQITSGILENSVWRIAVIQPNGNYELYDGEWTATDVPGKVLHSVDPKYCESIGKN